MVAHRDPPPELVDVRLLEFDPEDWRMLGDTGEWQAKGRWHTAREAWARAHPESRALGTVLDRIQDLMPAHYVHRRRM